MRCRGASSHKQWINPMVEEFDQAENESRQPLDRDQGGIKPTGFFGGYAAKYSVAASRVFCLRLLRVLMPITILVTGVSSAAAPANAVAVTISGTQLAEGLKPVFAGITIILNGYNPDPEIQSKSQGYHWSGSMISPPTGSYPPAQYGDAYASICNGQGPNFCYLLNIPQLAYDKSYPGRNYDDMLYFNIAKMGTGVWSPDVAAVPGALNLLIRFEAEGTEGVWKCLRWFDNGSYENCPDRAAGGQDWNRPVDWAHPLAVIRLEPTLVSGALGFRATNITFFGQLNMSGCGVVTSENFYTVCGYVSRYINDLNRNLP